MNMIVIKHLEVNVISSMNNSWGVNVPLNYNWSSCFRVSLCWLVICSADSDTETAHSSDSNSDWVKEKCIK